MEASKQQKSILISGASIAGLSTAYWLVRYGFKVTIVERAPYIRPGGQALDVRGPALEVAKQMGILEEIQNNSTKLKGMSIIDAQTATEIYTSTERTMTGGRLDSPDIEILRDDLCHVLFQAVGQATYIFNDSISSIKQHKNGADVTFSNAAPQCFDLVIGADGIRSNVRRLSFGPDNQFIRYLGHYVAVFTTPNFLELDHWELFVQYQQQLAAAIVVKDRDGEARTYLGFSAENPLDYDYRDITAQKRLVAERNAHIGWEIPKIVEHMHNSTNFYFDSVNQTIMDHWSNGLVTLVGDAGYSVSLSLGQGTTIAMVGAYVLAGELAAHEQDFNKGLKAYENELRWYVLANQKLVYDPNAQPEKQTEATDNQPEGIPDFGLAVIPFKLKSYKQFQKNRL